MEEMLFIQKHFNKQIQKNTPTLSVIITHAGYTIVIFIDIEWGKNVLAKWFWEDLCFSCGEWLLNMD